MATKRKKDFLIRDMAKAIRLKRLEIGETRRWCGDARDEQINISDIALAEAAYAALPRANASERS